MGEKSVLKMKGKARVEKFVGDIRTQGDGEVRGVVVVLHFTGVKVEDASGLVSQLHLLFNAEDDPALPELGALPVAREVNNVDVSIGDVKLKGADLSKIKITPLVAAGRGGKKVDVHMEVSSAAVNVLDKLHGMLKQTVLVNLVERQMDLTKLDGGVAPEPGEQQAAG
jgi:hypothetical protein